MSSNFHKDMWWDPRRVSFQPYLVIFVSDLYSDFLLPLLLPYTEIISSRLLYVLNQIEKSAEFALTYNKLHEKLIPQASNLCWKHNLKSTNICFGRFLNELFVSFHILILWWFVFGINYFSQSCVSLCFWN